LDLVWSEAPFASFEQFLATLNKISAAWLSEPERMAILDATNRARAELRG
jgi:hypothetical protein